VSCIHTHIYGVFVRACACACASYCAAYQFMLHFAAHYAYTTVIPKFHSLMYVYATKFRSLVYVSCIDGDIYISVHYMYTYEMLLLFSVCVCNEISFFSACGTCWGASISICAMCPYKHTYIHTHIYIPMQTGAIHVGGLQPRFVLCVPQNFNFCSAV
jgi:hypothetical protein